MGMAVRKRGGARKKSSGTAASTSKNSAWRFRPAAGIQILESRAFEELKWLIHGFSTRPGGTSDRGIRRNNELHGEKVLNLGFADWDRRENVLANRDRFFSALSASGFRVAALRQIHSDVAHCADSALPGSAPQGDALYTCEPGVLLTIQTADCVPILLADPAHRAVAAIHAGWRGTLRRIAAKTLGRMQMEFGTRPEEVIAALGPSIGRCCYEVGHDVAREFHAQFPEARDWFDGPFDALVASDSDANWLPWLTMRPPGHPAPATRAHLDLIAANRAILAAAGVAPGKISSSDFCTACRSELFFSYRREGSTGRLVAAIGIR